MIRNRKPNFGRPFILRGSLFSHLRTTGAPLTPSASPLLAKFVRCRAGLLAEEPREMRRIRECEFLCDVVDRLRRKNQLALGFAQNALTDQMTGGDAGGAFDMIVEPIDRHPELFGVER